MEFCFALAHTPERRIYVELEMFGVNTHTHSSGWARNPAIKYALTVLDTSEYFIWICFCLSDLRILFLIY